jgi:hypothetical protein
MAQGTCGYPSAGITYPCSMSTFVNPYTGDFDKIIAQFNNDVQAYAAGTVDSNVPMTDINNFNNSLQLLNAFQSNIAINTPEYVGLDNSSNFLTNFAWKNLENVELQVRLEVLDANITNSLSKNPSNSFAFYAVTGATILLGIICIFLITYLVYIYINSSGSSTGVLRGGSRGSIGKEFHS